MRKIKCLITCGPTLVPIDSMRVISNRSSGRMGQTIADTCHRAGMKVTLLEGPVQERLRSKPIKVVPFAYYDEFYRLFIKELGKKYDVVIHAAAVSDFKPQKVFKGKLTSEKKVITLKLVRTAKIIDGIKKKAPGVFLVGFKYEPRMSPAKAGRESRALFTKARCDLVLANSTDGGKYQGYLLAASGRLIGRLSSRESAARLLIKTIKERL